MAKAKKKTVVKTKAAGKLKAKAGGAKKSSKKRIAALPAKVVGRKKKDGAVRMILNAAKALKHKKPVKVEVKVVDPEVVSPPTIDVDEEVLLPGQEVEAEAVEAESAAEPSLQELTFEIKHDLKKRVDLYLRDRLPDYSRAMLQKLVKTGVVMVNDRAAKSSTLLRTGDTVHVVLPKLSPTEALPENIPLDVVYEDEQFIALNKQAGLIVHPARGHWNGTMINALLYHVQNSKKGGQLSTGSDPWRPGIIHRLDRDTTGLILVAKTDEAHWRLAGQFGRRTIKKTYMAIVHGEMELESDLIDAPLAVHPHQREKYAVREDIGKPAQTVYVVKERFKGYTLLELLPKTGRTHQLRVHMAHVGHPIVGDSMYGGRKITVNDVEPSRTGMGTGHVDPSHGEPLILRQALHAHRLQFVHPTKFTRMHLEAKLPPDMEHILELLRIHRRA